MEALHGEVGTKKPSQPLDWCEIWAGERRRAREGRGRTGFAIWPSGPLACRSGLCC